MWKVCQDGHPLRETGWNYSQLPGTGEEGEGEGGEGEEGEGRGDEHLPPFGEWSKKRKIQTEVKRDYSGFRLEMVFFFFFFSFCSCCCSCSCSCSCYFDCFIYLFLLCY